MSPTPSNMKNWLKSSQAQDERRWRENSGYHRIHGSRFKGVWMDSTWELYFAEQCELLGISWGRNNNLKLKYILDDKTRFYHPDFYLPEYNIFIEIKGRWTEESRLKMNLVEQNNKDKNIVYLESLKNIQYFLQKIK